MGETRAMSLASLRQRLGLSMPNEPDALRIRGRGHGATLCKCAATRGVRAGGKEGITSVMAFQRIQPLIQPTARVGMQPITIMVDLQNGITLQFSPLVEWECNWGSPSAGMTGSNLQF